MRGTTKLDGFKFEDITTRAINKIASDLEQKKLDLIKQRMEDIDPGIDIMKYTDRFSLVSRGEDVSELYYERGGEGRTFVIAFKEPKFFNTVSGHNMRLSAEFKYY